MQYGKMLLVAGVAGLMGAAVPAPASKVSSMAAGHGEERCGGSAAICRRLHVHVHVHVHVM